MALPIPVYEASFVIEYGNMERWRYYISELIIFNLSIFQSFNISILDKGGWAYLYNSYETKRYSKERL